MSAAPHAAAAAPLVTVITPYYNRAEHVTESIQSLLSQTYPNLEIIAVDDGSTDDTLARLKGFSDPRYRVLAKQNGGLVSALRQAIGEARGSLIAIHGSGDLSHPERIARQVEAMASSPEVGVVGCWVHNGVRRKEGYFLLKPPNGLPFTPTLLERNLFTHGEAMFRRDVYDRVGGYRTLFRHGQDLDLWLRMSRHCDYRIVEEPLYTRLGMRQSVSGNTARLLLQQRLAEFARQSCESVLAGGKDLIDAHGDVAPFYAKRSTRLSKELYTLGYGFLIGLRDPSGWSLIEAALEEKPTLGIRLRAAFLALHRNEILFWRVLMPLKRLLTGGGRKVPGPT
jgi:glycosyltransferase involved in cell wall biosynthesis